MKNKTIILIACICFVAVPIFWYFKADFFPLPIETKIKDAQSAVSAVKDKILKISKDISNPGPLFGSKKSTGTILTREGILMWTNIQRKQNSEFENLKSNPDLNKIAELRLDDMFQKQYFEHVSPTGESASDVADDVGYEYIAIGENIALGNFDNDEDIVQAWMNSPGHRANILNKRYREIGIAAKKGIYDGDEVWIAVQIFGRPLSDCTEPSISLKNQIENEQKNLENLKEEANALYENLSSLKNTLSPTEYNIKVDEYNVVVNKVNDKIALVKELIKKYNAQATTFNTCIEN